MQSGRRPARLPNQLGAPEFRTGRFALRRASQGATAELMMMKTFDMRWPFVGLAAVSWFLSPHSQLTTRNS